MKSHAQGVEMNGFLLFFTLTSANAEPTAQEAMQELSDLVEHVKMVEQARANGLPVPIGPKPAVKMADICYITLPDGKVQLEKCQIDGQALAVGQPVAGSVTDALAQAPTPYKELHPESVLPCALARTAYRYVTLDSALASAE